jgi:hypothetical protein
MVAEVAGQPEQKHIRRALFHREIGFRHQVHNSGSEEVRYAEQTGDAVETEVGCVQARTRPMDIACRDAKGDVGFQEPLDSHARLEIEFERSAQIGTADARRGYACAPVHKGNPASARCKIITQVGSKADEPFTVRRELRPGEQFEPELRVAAILVTLTHDMTKHLTVRKAGQGQVVGPAAAEGREAISRASAETK